MQGRWNDQNTADADRKATLVTGRASAPLHDALEQLRLEGAIFFRSEFTERWAYESPTAPEIAAMLRPGAERLIMFHIVAKGSCWITVGDDDARWAQEGDVIVLPYGDQHRVGGAEPAECVSIATLFEAPPWETLPVLRYGSGGDRTDLVCGYLYSEDPLFDPSVRALPEVFVVTPPSGPVAQWVTSSIDYALEASSASLPAAAPTRLPELLLTEVLRLHLGTAPAADHGWIAALRDPILSPALARLHGAPAEKWTVGDLAEAAAVSRSLLDERFRRVLGRSPMRYLTDWRMHIAKGLLSDTDRSIAQIARRVGYDSVEAFSRAFKRCHGRPPSAYRTSAV
jgi:AraC-like DNA-binding protein